MGLVEKRALKTFQEGTYQNFTKEINEVAGYPIEFDVNWDTLALEGSADQYEDSFSTIYFQPIVAALKEITSDEMGKEALKDALKKIEIRNTRDVIYASSAYTFSNGVLTIDHLPFTNTHHLDDRIKELTDLLMKQL